MAIYKFWVIWTKFWPFWSLMLSYRKMRSKHSSPLNRSEVDWKLVVEKSLSPNTGVHSKQPAKNLELEETLSCSRLKGKHRLPRRGEGHEPCVLQSAGVLSPSTSLPACAFRPRLLCQRWPLHSLECPPQLPCGPCRVVGLGCGVHSCVVIHGALNLSVEGLTSFGVLKRKSSLLN